MKKSGKAKYYFSIFRKRKPSVRLARQGISSIALIIFAALFLTAALCFTSLKFSGKNSLNPGESIFSRASAVIFKTLGSAFSGQGPTGVGKPVLEIDLGENTAGGNEPSPEKISGATASLDKISGQPKKYSAPDANGKNNIAENLSTSPALTENNQATSPESGILVQKKIPNCVFAKTGMPNHQIIFSEINWMGDKESANNEWIEIKNNSGRDMGLNGWQILSSDENIKIIFKGADKIDSGGFYLLERTDDNSAPGVTADAIYPGTLSNNGAVLKIFDADCNLSDKIDASKKWPAGNSATKRTMERSILDFSWHTGAADGGTPKKENTAAFSKGTEETADSPVNNQTAPTTANSETQNQPGAHILIAEIQITGGTGKTANDFIKVFNPNSTSFNLKGYRLVKRTKTGTSDTSIKSWTSDILIPPGGYYIWANSSFTALNPPADVTTSGSIADDNGIAIRQGSENTGAIIDALAWGGAQNNLKEGVAYPANPGANQILSRKSVNGSPQDTDNNQNDFEVK